MFSIYFCFFNVEGKEFYDLCRSECVGRCGGFDNFFCINVSGFDWCVVFLYIVNYLFLYWNFFVLMFGKWIRLGYVFGYWLGSIWLYWMYFNFCELYDL